jgi:hypothetical protein
VSTALSFAYLIECWLQSHPLCARSRFTNLAQLPKCDCYLHQLRASFKHHTSTKRFFKSQEWIASNAGFDIVCALTKIPPPARIRLRTISAGFSEQIGTVSMQWICTCQHDWKFVWSVPASHAQQCPQGVARDLQGLAKDDGTQYSYVPYLVRHTGMNWSDVAKA